MKLNEIRRRFSIFPKENEYVIQLHSHINKQFLPGKIFKTTTSLHKSLNCELKGS